MEEPPRTFPSPTAYGSKYQQTEAVRKLELLKLNDIKYIVPFMKEFIFYTVESHNTFNKEFMHKLLMKLPGPLGVEIQQEGIKFIEKGQNSYTNNVMTLAYVIMQYLEKKMHRSYNPTTDD